MKLLYAGCSQKGLVRSTNEDAYLMRTTDCAGLFMVADGIGGKEHGEVVSGMLRNGYDRWWQERSPLLGINLSFQSAVSELRGVLITINREVVKRFGEHTAGSTIALLFMQKGHYMYLSSGDSRIYRVRRLSFRQLTFDDVYENTLGSSSEFQMALVGKLVSAVGIRLNIEFSVRTDFLHTRDRFFLCSDGVYRYVSPPNLHAKLLFGTGNPTKLIDTFSRIVEDNGAGDNYSMIFVNVSAK